MHQSLRKASIPLIMIMIGCWSFNAYADDTIQHAAKEFVSAIQNPKELQDLIGDDGLIVIRNFVTGGWGQEEEISDIHCRNEMFRWTVHFQSRARFPSSSRCSLLS